MRHYDKSGTCGTGIKIKNSTCPDGIQGINPRKFTDAKAAGNFLQKKKEIGTGRASAELE